MRSIRIARFVPPALALFVALFGALVALALTEGHDAAAQGASAQHKPVSQKELALRMDMRRLWEDHVTWTRLAIISLTTESPDTEATVGRLLRNQADIGDAIAPYYGRAAGDELTRLLRGHILIAADLVGAAAAGDGAGVEDAQARWSANAGEIASFLAAANPRAWTVEELSAMLHEHLRLTTDEALARLAGDWEADVAAYDEIHLHALGMADALSAGIVSQFPRRFR
jgi:hypothetical protein